MKTFLKFFLGMALFAGLFAVYGFGQAIPVGRGAGAGQVTPSAPTGGAASFSTLQVTGLTPNGYVTTTGSNGTFSVQPNELVVTQTGTQQTPWGFGLGVPPAVVLANTTAGTNTFVPMGGPYLTTWYASEVSPDRTPAILTLSFDNLKGIAGITTPTLSQCTSLAFPQLVYTGTGTFTIGTMATLTSFSAPNLKYVSESITLSNLASRITTISLPELESVGNGLTITGNTTTTLNFPKLKNVGAFSINSMSGVTSVDFTALEYAGTFTFSSLSSLTTLSFPALTKAGAFTPSSMAALTTLSAPVLASTFFGFQPSTMASLTTLSFPALVSVGLNFTPFSMGALTTWSFPVLVSVAGTFAPNTMGLLVTISMPSMTTVTGALSVATMASLTTVSFPAMITYGSTITMNSALGNLANVTLGTVGTLKTVTGATINISGQKLTAASVNAILALLVSLDGTNGTTLWGAGKTLDVSGGTSSAPTGQGITDKATLIGRGATVTTN